MAIINIEVDTGEKTVSVKVDDKKIADVHDIHVFTETSGFFGVDIATVEEMDNLKKITRLVAKVDKPQKRNIDSYYYEGISLGLNPNRWTKAKTDIKDFDKFEFKDINLEDLVLKTLGLE